MRQTIDALLDLPPTWGEHPPQQAIVQFTIDGERYYGVEFVDDVGEGGVIAQLVPLDGSDG